MRKVVTILIILVVLVGLGFLVWKYKERDLNNPTPPPPQTTTHPLIHVDRPVANTLVASPLAIGGEARGNWYFEASFPVRLLDGNGKEIAVGIAQAQGDWMTTEFVPFETKLIFTNPSTPTGTLVFQKDNPSGLPEHDDELRVPVRFTPSTAELQTVKIYYYDISKDLDASGNQRCLASSLTAVERQIPKSIIPIQDAIKTLLKGEVSSLEKGKGLSTEFPLQGVALKSASLASNGELTLTFNDSQHQTSGGSCRVTLLRAQIEATAKEFSSVKKVKIAPPSLFQP